ncbi:hypothetical protein [Empedobacter brevis]|uniref:hypothetical protein n=1 Tax=Empedobacter brevis TaxID=247 RepID=UPI002FE05BA5
MKRRKNNLDIQNKIAILENYPDISEKQFKIFKEDIKKLNFSSNTFYKTLLIDFSIDEAIFNEKLHSYYYTLLQKDHQLIKLMVLDYLFVMNSFFNTDEAIIELKKVLKTKYVRNIVKNQIYINLIFLKHKKNENFQKIVEALISNLKKTINYRSHIRVYNYIIDYELYQIIRKEDVKKMIEISEKKELGKAVESSINKLYTILNIE